MSDPYLRNPYLAQDSEAVVESIIDMMLQTEELYSDQLGNYQRRIHRIQRQIKKEQEKLRAFLSENNLSEELPQFAQVLGDYLYPDSASEPVQTYINPEIASEKTHTVLEVYSLKEIASHEPGVNDAIRDSMDRIYKARNMLSKLTYKLEKLDSVYGESIEKKRSSADYKIAKKKNKEIVLLIAEVRSLRDVVLQVPDELAAEVATDDLNRGMNVFCSAYVVRKKKVIRDAADTFDEFPEDESLQETMENVLSVFETALPKQYTGVIENKTVILRLIDGVLSELGIVLADSLGELKTLAGSQGIPNEKVENIRKNVISVLRSQVKTSVVTRRTRDQMLAVNKSQIFDKKEEKDRFINALNEMSAKVSQGAEAMSEVVKGFGKRFFNKAIYAGGFPKTFNKAGEDALKDNQRDFVRQKYGGEIPFCDEVVIEHDDGTKEFVKKDEATEIEDGVYMKNSDLTKIEYFTEFGRDVQDVH